MAQRAMVHTVCNGTRAYPAAVTSPSPRKGDQSSWAMTSLGGQTLSLTLLGAGGKPRRYDYDLWTAPDRVQGQWAWKRKGERELIYLFARSRLVWAPTNRLWKTRLEDHS